jgi:hypothetical protein
MRSALALAALAAAILSPALGVAQEARPTPEAIEAPGQPTVLEDVVVEPEALERQAAEFTAEVAQQVRGRGLARWAGPVCIGVVNFRNEVARGLADGLAQLGGEVGVPIAEAPCSPNIFIVGTDDGRALAEAWVRRDYRDFRPNLSRAALPPSRLTDFVEMEAPVRWWAISRPTYFDIFTGRTIQTSNLSDGPPPRIPIYAKSMTSARTRDDLQRLVVILDVAEMESAPMVDLIAYLGLVAFSQVDMRADMSAHDTVLNLFNGSHSGGGLTEWDRAYLATLYAAPDDLRINEHRQAERLTRRLRTGGGASTRD